MWCFGVWQPPNHHNHRSTTTSDACPVDVRFVFVSRAQVPITPDVRIPVMSDVMVPVAERSYVTR